MSEMQMGAQDVPSKMEKMEKATLDPDYAYPLYPSEHSDEARRRAEYIGQEIATLEEQHYNYMEQYNHRHMELELMLRMCHQAIVEYEQATQPQHGVPMTQSDGVMKAPSEAQRSIYDTGVRPPKIPR